MREFRINVLLNALREKTETLLTAIDTDPLLRRRERGDLVIANASKALFSPKQEHHLFAKGIVYRRNPYEVVSLPLLKVYNYGERADVDTLTEEMLQDEDIYARLVFKDDGYMGQIFAYDGDVICTTRSVMEGTGTVLEEEYTGLLRAIANMKYPCLLDPSFIGNLSVICEVVHPSVDNITRYESERDIIVLAIFDRSQYRYWTNDEIREWCAAHGLRAVETLKESVTLAEALDTVQDMNEDKRLPEGAILLLEDDTGVVHRVKLKTESWVRAFGLRHQCTLKTVVTNCFEEPRFLEWKEFERFLKEEGRAPEELLPRYQELHEEYSKWVRFCVQEVCRYRGELAAITERVGTDRKDIAIYLKKTRTKKDFALLMLLFNGRKEEELVLDVMYQNALHPVIRPLVQKKRAQMRV